MRGECFCCERVGRCPITSVKLILESFTCDLFTAVPEPVYKARAETLKKYGAKSAAQAMRAEALRAEREEES